MFKNYFTWALLCLSGMTQACDICGYSTAANFMGSLPQIQKSFIGLRYSQIKFTTEQLSIVPVIHSTKTINTSTSSDIWCRYAKNSKIQVLINIPFIQNKVWDNGVVSSVSGIGDATALFNYILVNSTQNKRLKHLWMLNAGIKIPTGKFQVLKNELLLNPNIQLGSGSFDLPISTLYSIRKNNISFQSEANYKLNTYNVNGYKFGNRWSCLAKLGYWFSLNKLLIIPSTSIILNATSDDKRRNTGVVNYTGGTSIQAVLGCDIYYKNISATLNIQKPIYEYLSNGNTHSNARVLLGVNYLF